MRLIHVILVAVLFSVGASAASSQDGEASADLPRSAIILLDHVIGREETTDGTKRSRGSGLSGSVESDVTGGMDAVEGKNQNEKEGSRLSFKVSTRVEERDDGVWVFLDAEMSEPEIAESVEPLTEISLEQEAERVLDSLQAWSSIITGPDLDRINLGQSVPVDLTGQFANLRYWSVRKVPTLGAALQRVPGVRLDIGTLTLADPNPGLPFRGMLIFDETPKNPPEIIEVHWADGSLDLPVFKTNRPTVLVTNWQFPTPNHKHAWGDVNRFQAQKPAVDLVGTWAVAHSDKDKKEVTGGLVVEPGGTSMKIILNPGPDVVAYSSVEILSTSDPNVGTAGVEVRFERKTDPAWETPANVDRPKGEVLMLPGDVETLKLRAMGYEEEVQIYLPEGQPIERLRLQLWDQNGDGRLQGTWNFEDAEGFLTSGGQQTWTRSP